MPIEKITRDGKTIYYIDYTQCKDVDEMIALLEESAEMHRQSPIKLLTIDDFTGKYATKEFMDRAKELGKDYSLGIEMMLGIDVFKWWHIDLMGNIYDYRVEGKYTYEDNNLTQEIDFSENSCNWNSRFNNTIRIGKSTRLQLNGMYNSPTVSAQGERDGFFMTNLALRQSFYKNKISATLQVRDVFGTMKHSAESSGPDFYQFYEFNPNTPLVTLTLSFKLNNYKPDRRNRDAGDEDLGGDNDF